MKPPPFGYAAPRSLAEALDVLAELGADGKVLAGGQSLLPLLNMRLAAPAYLVDINRLAELGAVVAGPAAVRVGATARHAAVAADQAAYGVLPLLREALRLVAHPVIRNRGTTVGSLAHADPAGELTAVLALLGGRVELARRGSTRIVPAAEFFLGPLESAVEPGELATWAEFPVPPARTGTAIEELSRRHGDYALVGVAVAVTLDDETRVAAARSAYLSVAPVPLVLDLAEAVRGQPADRADWAAAGRLAAGRVDPEADIHASAEFRRHLAGVLTARALSRAAGRALSIRVESGPVSGSQ